MRKSVFPWNMEDRCSVNDVKQLKVSFSCQVQHGQIQNGSLGQGEEKEIIEGMELQLQIRESYIILFDRRYEQIIDFFICNLNLYFLIREIKQNSQQQQTCSQHNQKNILFIQFSHLNHNQQHITFLIKKENKSALEQFGRTLQKHEIIQKDFHRKFKPLRKIGKGSTASVFSAVRHHDSEVVAIKAFNKSTHFTLSGGKGKKAFQKELKVLTECNHENLCKLQGLYETDNTIYIVMKNYGKTLSSLLHSSQRLPRLSILSIMEELLRGVAYLHARGIMHRDLKLENIMVDKNQSGMRATIIDMGMAEFYHQEAYLYEQCGTPGYAAPEMFGPRPPHPEKCDVFSLGVVFYILLFRKAVFAGETAAEICRNNKLARLSLDMSLIDQEDRQVKDLLLRMLELDNTQRISAAQALHHDFFNPKIISLSSVTTEVISAQVPNALQL